MKDWIQHQALGLVLPLILGPLAFLCTKWLKQGVTFIDHASPAVKQAIVVALTFILAGIVKAFGAYLPSTCTTADALTCVNALADPDAIKVILSALIAMAIHAGQATKDTR